MVALGSPGGATIITTVLQMLVNHVDFGMSLPEAVAAPRASQRNAATTPAEPAFIARYGALRERPTGFDHVTLDAGPRRRASSARSQPRSASAARPPAGGGRADPPRRRLGDGGAARAG